MKFMLILSSILCVPFFLLSLSITVALTANVYYFGKEISGEKLLILAAILAVSVSVIMSTTIAMVKYSGKINDLDKAEEDCRKKQRLLNATIAKYNQLIQQSSI